MSLQVGFRVAFWMVWHGLEFGLGVWNFGTLGVSEFYGQPPNEEVFLVQLSLCG